MHISTHIASLIDSLRADIARGAEGLDFDADTHTYTYRGEVLPAVSTVCQMFEPKFNEAYWAAVKGAQEQVSAEEMCRRWRENARRACDEGTNVHTYGEWRFYKHTGLPIDDKAVAAIDAAVAQGMLQRDYRMDSIDRIWDAIDAGSFFKGQLYPVASENRIVNPELGYAGTFDLLCLHIGDDGEPRLIIFDYKTNRNLFNIFKDERMLEPLDTMASCAAAGYACQLNLYQLGLERVVDIPVSARVLLWVSPEGVEAIHANSDDGYYRAHRREEATGKKSKWGYMRYNKMPIEHLKRAYHFTPRQGYALLALPDLRDIISRHLARVGTIDIV